MHSFNIDEQTFKDLNIFTGGNHSGAIYELFKGVRTLGAREKLKEMMLKPSSDITLLTRRRDTIKYFNLHKINFDIRNEELDLIEFYLKIAIKIFRGNPIDSAAEYLSRNSSNNYYVIKTGLKYLIKLVRYLNEFIQEHSTADTPDDLNNIFREILEIIEVGILKDALLMNEKELKFLQVSKLDRALRGAEKDNLRQLLDHVYALDIFEHIADIATAKGFTFPEYRVQHDQYLAVTGLFHPNLKHPVKNDVVLDKEKNIVLLTGSNMSGKSSFLKAVGLVIYLAHLGFPVAAKHMETTIFNGLITTINLPDDMNQGLSHYYSEVKRVKEVANALLSKEKIFVIFDELFRGTNVKDAFDASNLIISELSAVKNSAFLISTHIVELTAELDRYSNIRFQYMDTYFENDQPVFTYQLKNGVSKERLGMFIVINEGIVEIIKKAAARPC